MLGVMGREVEAMRRPDGSREHPARSCHDIKIGYKDIEDGHYWVDPNRGCSRDAIPVYCRFSEGGGATCLPPHNYTQVSPVQLRFLRLLSSAATQSVSRRCPAGGAIPPLKLIAANGERLEPGSDRLSVTDSQECGDEQRFRFWSPDPVLFPLSDPEGVAEFSPVCFSVN